MMKKRLVKFIMIGITTLAPILISQGIALGLSGSKVFEQNCGKCHLSRQPKERSDKQWKMITEHMRVRANLTAEESRSVLEYLQSSN